ncbi:EthD family reductase [soil metagenome]
MPRAAVVVLYHHPTDADAFEQYYNETHMPLVGKHAGDLGATHATFTKFTQTLDGQSPPFYRKAEMWFESEEALRKALGSEAFQAIAGDLPNFATGGITPMISVETH